MEKFDKIPDRKSTSGVFNLIEVKSLTPVSILSGLAGVPRPKLSINNFIANFLLDVSVKEL